VLAAAVRERRNIVVAGGTSSGKTTLVNALLAEVASLQERVVILEDTRELRCAAEDVVALRTKPGVASLADLVRSTLRLRPDRIIVGGVRGGEALDMLKAWNTGHPGGLTTVHANSAEAALTRLEQLVQEAIVTVPRPLIAEAIDLVVFIKGRGGERRVESILELVGLDEDGSYASPMPPRGSSTRSAMPPSAPTAPIMRAAIISPCSTCRRPTAKARPAADLRAHRGRGPASRRQGPARVFPDGDEPCRGAALGDPAGDRSARRRRDARLPARYHLDPAPPYHGSADPCAPRCYPVRHAIPGRDRAQARRPAPARAHRAHKRGRRRSTPEYLASFLPKDIVRWGKVIRDAGLAGMAGK
jgi:hypothetical protein